MFRTSTQIALILLTFVTLTNAQSQRSRIEIGVQSTSLTLFDPDFPGDVTEVGVGGRVGYNITRSIAAEAEINYFPQKRTYFFGEGKTVQAQFGIKAGKRFDKFGIFAKARPGFLTAGNVFTTEPGSTAQSLGFTLENTRIGRKTLFTMDVGGVVEFYPTRRTVVRLEAGDTIVRHYRRYDYTLTNPPVLVVAREAKFNHNFQFTVGFGFRLDDYGNEPDVAIHDKLPRFEVGAQFTSITVNAPRINCGSCGLIVGDPGSHIEPGFGGRFTYNLTDNIALEGESNFFTRERFSGVEPGGHMFQGQFGVKAGKRFERWGLFGKGRPGFVGFTRASELVGTHTQSFGSTTIVVGDFRTNSALYPSVDVGGVLEFYISRHWMTRMDFGDTIIWYRKYQLPGFIASQPIATRPPETHHNFQYSAGIGFRF